MTEAAPPTDASARLDAEWLRWPGLRALMAALAARGATPRYVGGCVRNALIGATVADIDVAIDRPPAETAALLAAAGLPAHPTGVEHGTYTTVVAGPNAPEPVEITSLRRDVATDGRRAVVAFTEDWREDAERRDFTMNALYADADGRVFDPWGEGLDDLRARRLRFIGDAERRIREDALRILRYYRFAAWYAPTGAALRPALDSGDLAAVAAAVGAIDGLARERIGAELRKLLAAPDPSAATALAAEHGALARSLPPDAGAPEAEAAAVAALGELVAIEAALGLAPAPLRRLTLLAGARPRAALVAALRLSKADADEIDARRRADAILTGGEAEPSATHAAYRCGAAAARDALAVAAARRGLRPDPARLAQIDAAAEQVFPLGAADLIALGWRPGPALGAELRRLEDRWIASRFGLDAATLRAAAAEPPDA